MYLLQTREDELKSCKQDQSRVRQLRDNLNNKLQLVDKEKSEVERERDDVKAQVAGLERGQAVQPTSCAECLLMHASIVQCRA